MPRAARSGHTSPSSVTRVAFAGGPRVSVESRIVCKGCARSSGKRGIRMREEDISFCASYEAEDGAVFAAAFLRQPVRPTVVLGNDALAIGFIRAAQQRGSRFQAICRWRDSMGFRRGAVVAGSDDDGAADAGDGT